ncbi:MAG: ubiquitin-like domain-containing protein, partial [Anaerolineae bacterium]|nr:ubiquitin-like domain-containing protein [Anaerolineae bacterium]
QRPFSQNPPRVIRVIRAVTVTIQNDEAAFNLTTTAATVGGALKSSDLVLYVADKVNPPLDTPLSEGMTIEIIRSRPVTIFMDSRSMVTRTTAATVQVALAELGIVLSGLDYVIPHETAAFDSTIRIVRVMETFEIVEESLPYRTLMRPDENLPLDTRMTLQIGENGLLKKRFRVRVEDGQVISRILMDSWVENAPIDEVVTYGTQIQTHTLSTVQGDIKYWRVLKMNVIYTKDSLSKGTAAVDTDIIPLGSQLYIEGHGIVVAAEALPENGLSIALTYEDGNIQHRTVEVYLLTPVPEDFPYFVQESS